MTDAISFLGPNVRAPLERLVGVTNLLGRGRLQPVCATGEYEAVKRGAMGST